MESVRDRQEWRKYGRCVGLPTQIIDTMFFFGSGGRPTAAEKFCAECPVKQECLNYAILYNEDGVWGGTIKDQRKILREIPTLIENLREASLQKGTLEDREDWTFVRLTPVLDSPGEFDYEILEVSVQPSETYVLEFDLFAEYQEPPVELLVESESPIAHAVA